MNMMLCQKEKKMCNICISKLIDKGLYNVFNKDNKSIEGLYPRDHQNMVIDLGSSAYQISYNYIETYTWRNYVHFTSLFLVAFFNEVLDFTFADK